MWKMADRTTSYLARALAARGGLGGNHGYEAAYPMTYADKDGHGLDGHNRYTLTFDEDPPVGAFWSITMYDLPRFFLLFPPPHFPPLSCLLVLPPPPRAVAAPLQLLRRPPPPADPSNWLPAPAAPFRPIMRLYQPGPAVLDGSYK